MEYAKVNEEERVCTMYYYNNVHAALLICFALICQAPFEAFPLYFICKASDVIKALLRLICLGLRGFFRFF